jgi:hypothetical protein
VKVSLYERWAIEVMRLNKKVGIDAFVYRWEWFGRRFKFEKRSADNIWGRFGGGWQWEVGVQVGTSSVIINLLVCSLRIDGVKREASQ